MNETLPEWFSCSCDEPFVLYTEPGAEGWYQHEDDTVDQQLRINQSCVLPQCPLEAIVGTFDEETMLLGHYNDTTHPYHYNVTVSVMCSRGYTTPSGDRMSTYACRMQDGVLGWYDMMNNSLADNSTSRCIKETVCRGDVLLISLNYTDAHTQECDSPFNFNITSICDLSPATNEYMLQRDVLCPVVDCGMPDNQQTLGSTNLTVNCTTLGCSFEFTCDGGSLPLPVDTPTTIVCQEDGRWNYSNIYCEGTTCPDPGVRSNTYRYATEAMDSMLDFTLSNLKSGGRVYYDCIRPGYGFVNISDGTAFNYTECNGTHWYPMIQDFECQDMEAPEVVDCPSVVSVFRYSSFNGTPFEEEFLGYPSPMFTDNTGISAVRVNPYKFHSQYVFDEDINVTFTPRDFAGNEGEECLVQYQVIDIMTPMLKCSDLYVAINATYPQVNITDEMVMEMVLIDGMMYNSEFPNPYQEISVEFSSEQMKVVNVDIIKGNINQNAQVTVTRMWHSGAMIDGEMVYHENRTVSAQCSVAILPQADLCWDEFAPDPIGADRECMDLENGDRECTYVCSEHNALIFAHSSQLYSNATSTCSDPAVGFTPVGDCIISGYAVAVATHAFVMSTHEDFEINPTCYEALVAGYKNWTLETVCNGSIADIRFALTQAGESTDLSELILYNFNLNLINGFPKWHAIPYEGMRGAERICDDGAADLRQITAGTMVNLSSIDACLSDAWFTFSSLDQMEFVCESDTLLPIQAGETIINNVSYPYYSCFQCPAGTYLREGVDTGSSCEPCPIGEFYPAQGTHRQCLSCPPGTDTAETGQTVCSLTCPAGYYSDTGMGPCSPCPVGSYWINETYCEMCPNGTIGRSNAQTSEESCRPMCMAGTYSEDGYAPMDGDCMACPANFFSATNGSTSCDRCADNEDTAGSTGNTECQASAQCPEAIGDRCAAGNVCYQFNGIHVCTNGCLDDAMFQGQQCDIEVTNCDRKSCDAVGVTECNTDTGECICNSDIAGGALCDNITLVCDKVCENGGECFLAVDSYSEGAGLTPICLCGGQWSGDTCTIVEDKCEDSPCVDMHTENCVSDDVRAHCECKLGYTGYYCEMDIDGCMSSPCYNDGNCTDVVGNDITNDDPFSFTCECMEGFEGDQCEIRVDECDSQPCGELALGCEDDYQSVNSVFCLSTFFNIMVDAYTSVSTTSFCQSLEIECENDSPCVDDEMNRWACECSDIYAGVFCQHRIDFCKDEPCGEGVCSNLDDAPGYTCVCDDGYIFNSTTCVNIDECDLADICVTGECIDTPGSFLCVCDEEHDGLLCQTNINECLFMPCMGNSTCEDTDDDYICHCEADRTGEHCELELNMCDDQCENDGECMPVYGDFVCQCNPPSYGRLCENLHDVCETENPCVYGGDCDVEDDFEVMCTDCDAGHDGQYCQLWTHECTINPCENGGECSLAYGSGYICDCPEGFLGNRCERTILDPCDESPCQPGALCIRQGLFDYRCQCPSGFIGSSCLTPIDADFDLYFHIGDDAATLDPTISPYWDGRKFTVSSWIRPDRVMNDDDEYIDIIHLTVSGEVVLRMNAQGCIFMGRQYNISNNPDLFFTMGVWAFFGCSIDTNDAGDASTITVYANGIAITYDLPDVPPTSYGPLATVIGPNRDFLGYCGQVYLWAGASFPGRDGAQLSALLELGRGAVVSGSEFQGSFIHYYWTTGTYRVSPFCEIGRPASYCTVCDDDDDNRGTYLEFERECPNDKLVTTSARAVAVDWVPPIFLANGEVVQPDTPNILPGSVLGIGRHKVKYELKLNRKKLKCSFKIYVRSGCDGVMVGRRCVRPNVETGVTYPRAVASCLNFGGVLLDVTSGLESTVAEALVESDITDRELLVGGYYGADDNPQCISVSSGGDVTASECTDIRGLICGRPVASTESCVLPDAPSGLSLTRITALDARLLKYSLSCDNAGEVLASYAPQTITCYPEGNWDYDYGQLPRCVPAAPPAIRFRFRIKIRFRIRVRNPCRTGSSSITYDILYSVWTVLQRLNTRWNGGLIGSRSSVPYCCNDAFRGCDTSPTCGGGGFALRCGCSARAFGRRKRQTADEGNDNEIEMELTDLGETVNGPSGESLTPEEVITAAVASNEFTDEVSNILNVIEDNPLDGFSSEMELDCPEGYEAVDVECVPCTPGTYWTNGTCELCPVDTYQPDVNATECLACDPDTTTYFVGATNETQCQDIAQPGQFYNGVEIQNCSLGYYQPNVSASECIACEPGTTTVQVASTADTDCIDVCASGQEFDSGTSSCEPCVLGYHRDALIHLVCQKCPQGYITLGEGATSEGECTIVDCGAGTYRNESANECMSCERGTYQDEIRMTECKSCGDNYTTAEMNSTQRVQCQFICPDGHSKVDNAEECVLCEAGFYRARDDDMVSNQDCTECAQYYTTPTTGSVTVTSCSILQCPAGMQSNDAEDDCELCPMNTYSDSLTAANVKCEACEADYVTANNGSANASDCFLSCPDAGEESFEGTCRPCLRGFYAEDGDQICLPCPDNYTTVAGGNVSPNDCSIVLCDAGYRREEFNETCIACEVGFYQDQDSTNITMCTACPNTGQGDSQTTETEGADSVDECRITCLAGHEDQNDTCVACAIGFYKEEMGSTACTQCPQVPVVLTTSMNGSTQASDCDIAICDAGYYSDGVVCTACDLGYYQEESEFMGNSCIPCGKFNGFDRTTPTNASTSDDDCTPVCPAGYRTDVVESCVICPEDTYLEGDSCMDCPEDFSSNNVEGGTSNATCTHRICVPGEENSNSDPADCVPCPLNTYNDAQGETCKDCPGDSITMSTGKRSIADCIDDCPGGEQYSALQARCVKCPRGTYRADNATSTEEDFRCKTCKAGFTTETSGCTSCLVPICDRGEYPALVDGSYMCMECRLGTYQPDNDGALICIDCGSELTTNSTGKTSEDDCIPVPTCANTPCPHDKHTCTDADNGSICSCPSAYISSDNTCTHHCDRTDIGSYCENNGICNRNVDIVSLVCTCKTGFSGERCTAESGTRDSTSRTTTIIVGVVAGVVLLAVLLTAVIIFAKKGVCAPTSKAMMYQEPMINYMGSVSPPQAYYTGPNQLQHQQLRDIDEISHRVPKPMYIQ